MTEELGMPAPQNPPGLRRLVGERMLVTTAQILAGGGNLLFAIIAARILAPGDFAALVAFLALYLIIHMPTGSLGAASALAPERAPALRRRLVLPVLMVSVVVVAATPHVSTILGLSPPMVILAALTVVAAPFLSIERGQLHGVNMNGRVALTLVVEPLARLGIGIPMAVWLGAVGGAAGVVLAGYASFGAAILRRRDDPRGRWMRKVTTGSHTDDKRSPFWWTAGAFLLLALFQKQDVLFANRLLPPDEAAVFAVVATLGGAAVLASVRVPLVLIPRAIAGSRRALAVALGLAGGLGLGAVGVTALAPELIVTTIFGLRYERAGGVVIPYMAAMAVLAVTRVLAAYQCSAGRPRTVTLLVGAVVSLHVVLLLAMSRDAPGVVAATLWANVALVTLAAIQAIAILRRPIDHPRVATGRVARVQ